MWRAPSKQIARNISCSSGPAKPRGPNVKANALLGLGKRGFSQTHRLWQNAAPPPPSRGGGGGAGSWILPLTGLTVVGVGGNVAYALYEPTYREFLEEKVPYADLAFQYLPAKKDITKNNILRGSPALSGSTPKSEDRADIEQVPEKVEAKSSAQLDLSPKGVAVKAKKKKIEIPEEVAKEIEKEQDLERKRQDKLEVDHKIKEEEDLIMERNKELEEQVDKSVTSAKKLVQRAVDLHHHAAEVIANHTKLFRKTMDESSEGDKESHRAELFHAGELKKKAQEEAERMRQFAHDELEMLKKAIEDGKAEAKTEANEILAQAQDQYSNLKYELDGVVAKVSHALSESNILHHYKDRVEKGKDQFQKEMESIVPDVKLGEKGQKLSVEELNSLLSHAHRRIDQLQKQLAEHEVSQLKVVGETLEQQRTTDEKLLDSRLQIEKEALISKFEIEKKHLETNARIEFEKELRQALARQAAAYNDHLTEVLATQRKDLEAEFDKMAEEAARKKHNDLNKEITSLAGRLFSMELAIQGQALKEMEGGTAHEYWLASQALLNAITTGTGDAENPKKPLEEEIAAVRDAAGLDPFVASVLNGVPSEAVDKGVWSADSLKSRFEKVYKVCRRVALVGENGAGPMLYLLSWLQQLFIFDTGYTASPNSDMAPEEVNTISLLARAKYFMDRGNFENAVKYIGQLQGMPKRVASDWLRDARVMVETKQAADVLAAHASARGLGAVSDYAVPPPFSLMPEDNDKETQGDKKQVKKKKKKVEKKAPSEPPPSDTES
ncbi:MICOS complex subunit MIC60-1 [Lingula anatina]|uniref:MICOS complex subunit MIC60 n=1 Tax=Lingula anatina TaxID=7574 RepID=A0A1S3IG32_LINAN|nr:MICOS complex subunit MIC60-1 [Lingula anatina]|eukprot:XP_013397177.1 MICOS complex subunit MIC60-1 [Lingula anatina]